ncbi:hypothetical protein ACFQ3P_20895 [Paraburkholderia sabiae]|uniref:Uncharacterized protein n=1 Tax=Paraburkholderia sabiae TaxID=273251 RepID=A0ABU9QBA3_9BURK|nr:hypothetical protein [Paraburkholderia sabiae]WJZ71540.1 hypothetical protein QEN71_15190 [Paraburkholderia sabiae]CAG9189763.1 conserved hypothetical protein [Paraburkholderia sabiae]
MDTKDSRGAASSCATSASLSLLTPCRFATDATDFEVTDAARAAEAVEAFFRATGVAVSADAVRAEELDLAALTSLVLFGSSEPLPVAIFPPVVFTIAIAFYRLCLEKNKTAEIL